MENKKLPRGFYLDTDVVAMARQLLGKKLCTYINGEYTAGIITETEAYNGIGDRACHAYGNRCTARTGVMFKPGGHTYVYLCYGIHMLLNVVTGPANQPTAILIRGIQPVDGIDIMLMRRGMTKNEARLTAGPGNVTRALGITREHNEKDLNGNEIWIEDSKPELADADIVITTRIGVDYAKEDAALPYRFYIKGNKYVTKPVR